MAERIFDTSRYKSLPDSLRTPVIQEDLSGLAIEDGDLPLEERINPRRLEIRGHDVIDPTSKRSVLEHLNEETPFNRRESLAARSFYRNLTDGDPGALVVSISAPGGDPGYPEGRVNVGLRANSEVIEFYGIPTRLSPKALYIRAILLNEHSSATLSFSNPEELREISIPVMVPSGDNPWEFLGKALPLDSGAWEAIKQGGPWLVKKRAGRDAEIIAQIASARIVDAKTGLDYLYAGALMEKLMTEAGWVFDNSACPGLFNSQILQMKGLSLGFLVTDSFGNIRLAERKYVERCGKCKRKIGDFIPSGYQCPHCKKFYKGC